MNKSELLFYDAYEDFYAMAKESKAFQEFCRDAFGEDFSQDGFSNIEQVDIILKYISDDAATHILDIGCGNGKMLRYLQQKKNCRIYGFDYSANAIETAKAYADDRAEYREGIIGEIEYPEDFFDVIISMDTMYFAKDMTSFVGQIYQWLRKAGTIFVAYQEGDVMPKTDNAHTTVLAQAFRDNNLSYEVTDISKETYEMLKQKREAAIKHKDAFYEEGHQEWWDMLMWQTEISTESYEQFASQMARYIYVVKK